MEMFGCLDPESQLFLLITLEFLDALLYLVKERAVREYVRHDEVEQGPELPQVVVERSSSQK